MSAEELSSAQRTANEAGFDEALTPQNAIHAVEQILNYHVIETRLSCLRDLKICIEDTGILKFLEGKDFIWSVVFPRSSDINYPVSLILDRLHCDGNQTVMAHFIQFVLLLSSANF